MFKLLNFIVLLQIFTHFEFGACNMAQLLTRKDGQGSPLCEQLREHIVLQFKNNVSQSQLQGI